MHIHGMPAANRLPESSPSENPKLTSAAHEFEASLMKEFLKPLEHDSLFAEEKPGETDTDEGSDSALMSFGSQAMATAISERGGFGIATLILNHFRDHPGTANNGGSPLAGDFQGRSPQITKVISPSADKGE
jgi:flagellar protein FlgJ